MEEEEEVDEGCSPFESFVLTLTAIEAHLSVSNVCAAAMAHTAAAAVANTQGGQYRVIVLKDVWLVKQLTPSVRVNSVRQKL